MLRQPDTPRRRGFTLIELLVVIAIIGLLIAAMAIVGGKVMHHQRVNLTETIMRGTTMAIDQFSEENPLRSVYDRKGERSFGSMPPYQLPTAPTNMQVAMTLESQKQRERLPTYDLQTRIKMDLFGHADLGYVQLDEPSGDYRATQNNDIRALHAYLNIFAPEVLEQLPAVALKPLSGEAEYVDTDPDAEGEPESIVPVLGIHDAWGVPMDYLLYVRIQAVAPDECEVTDRIPVLRSRGVSVEEAEAELDNKRTWIFSQPFPSPQAGDKTDPEMMTNFRKFGMLQGNSAANGWARAIGLGDRPAPQIDPGDERLFGYAP